MEGTENLQDAGKPAAEGTAEAAGSGSLIDEALGKGTQKDSQAKPEAKGVDTSKGEQTDAEKEAAKKEAEAAKRVIPEKYELKVPEGMTVDQNLIDAITPVFKELGVTQEGAQKLADAYAPFLVSQVEAQRTQALQDFQNTTNEWKKETTKEFGADYQKKVAAVGRAINKFGDEELRQILNDTGLGQHKALARFMSKVGEAFSEDRLIDGKRDVGMAGKTAAEILYPSNTK